MSYITNNMRAMDELEIFCQFKSDNVSENAKLLSDSIMTNCADKFIAKIDGQPVAAFGVQEKSPRRFIGWAFGTNKMRRAIPEVTRFIRSEILPALQIKANRIEAESLSTHKDAHRWLKAFGAVPVCTLARVGKDGEDFILFEKVF